MGCDIHSVGQIFKNGKWVTKEVRPGGDDRNYDSFAVLADVRNGTGFAGVATGEGWPVIDEPRGLPEDLDFYEEDEEEYVIKVPAFKPEWADKEDAPETTIWLGDHSHSWLLLSEIEEFLEKNIIGKTYKKIGVVTRETYEDIKSGKLTQPKSWSGGTFGPKVVCISAEEADKGKKSTHVRMSWTIPSMGALHTLKKYVEALRSLAEIEKVPHKEVRLVFGFDS